MNAKNYIKAVIKEAHDATAEGGVKKILK